MQYVIFHTLLRVILNGIPAICMILGEFYVGMIMSIYIIVGFGATGYVNTLLLDRCKEVQ